MGSIFGLPGFDMLFGFVPPPVPPTYAEWRQVQPQWSGALAQPDPAMLFNAYRPLPPTDQELALAETNALRTELGKTDWLWLGWLVAMAGGLALKAVLG